MQCYCSPISVKGKRECNVIVVPSLKFQQQLKPQSYHNIHFSYNYWMFLCNQLRSWRVRNCHQYLYTLIKLNLTRCFIFSCKVSTLFSSKCPNNLQSFHASYSYHSLLITKNVDVISIMCNTFFITYFSIINQIFY